MSQRPAGLRPDHAVADYLFPALKGNYGVPGLVAEDAVDSVGLQVAERDEPPLQRRDRVAMVAVAQLSCGRCARQRKHDNDPSD